MAYMAPSGQRPDDPAVDLDFIKNKGVTLDHVVKALTKAGQDYVMGHAIEVRRGRDTEGYLIYVPFTVQDFVDEFFRAQEETK